MSTKQRSSLARFDDLPGTLPEAHIPEDVDVQAIANSTVAKLQGLGRQDFTDDALWRDFLSFTGSIRTFHSSKTISVALDETRKIRRPYEFKPSSGDCRVVRIGPGIAWVDAGFTFSIDGGLEGSGAGIVSVVPDKNSQDGWSIWMLRTWLENFDGHGHPDQPQSNGTPANGRADSPRETHEVVDEGSNVDFEAVVVGGGQAGLGCAGRLQALGVSYTVLEKSDNVGDIWATRYESLRFHTSKPYGNLPFDPTFLPEDDYMLTTGMIAAGHQRFVQKYGINVRLSTTVEHASWDKQKKRWQISISSPDGHSTVSATNLILAVGGYANTPVSPEWPGRERYKGTVMHGAAYRSSKPWTGKKGIVVGTANTGHDVAEDMVLANFSSVTMVQRGSTFVFPAEWLHKAQDVHYNDQIPTATADRQAFTWPNKIMRDVTNRTVFKLIDSSPERFDALERAGFKVERKGDIYDNLYIRFGGHYVDIGTSDRIAKGQIKMKSDSAVKEWTEDGLKFEDGSEVKADLIVLCTGYEHDFRKNAARLIGEEAADKMDDYFGMDSEGEVRGCFKFAGHPRLYYHGGDVRMARWFSRFIALQIQADVLGKPLQPYLNLPC